MIKLKYGDKIIIAAVLLCAVLIYLIPGAFLKSGTRTAVIRIDGKVYKELDLNAAKEKTTITLSNGYENKITLEDGKIWFEDSDCPDRLCVKSGKLEKPGDFAACLPNRVSISVTGESAGVDTVSK